MKIINQTLLNSDDLEAIARKAYYDVPFPMHSPFDKVTVRSRDAIVVYTNPYFVRALLNEHGFGIQYEGSEASPTQTDRLTLASRFHRKWHAVPYADNWWEDAIYTCPLRMAARFEWVLSMPLRSKPTNNEPGGD